MPRLLLLLLLKLGCWMYVCMYLRTGEMGRCRTTLGTLFPTKEAALVSPLPIPFMCPSVGSHSCLFLFDESCSPFLLSPCPPPGGAPSPLPCSSQTTSRCPQTLHLRPCTSDTTPQTQHHCKPPSYPPASKSSSSSSSSNATHPGCSST